jgi:hypothetical protein
MKFKVGDRVRCTTDCGFSWKTKGEIGTVKIMSSPLGNVGVEFDNDVNGHDFSGKCTCKDGHGLWVSPRHLEPIPKFKVGDRVVGIGEHDCKNVDGKYGTIVRIDEGPHNPIGVGFDYYIDGHSCGCKCENGHGWFLPESKLKLVDAPKWKVLIMPECDTTTGRLYEDGKVVKSVSTKKHPDDEYSIDKACEVIMDRLFPKIIKQDKYEVGDKVKIVDKWNDKTKENSVGHMDKYLGTVMTIRGMRYGEYRMEEDKADWDDGWYWNKYCIEGKVVDSKEPPKPVKPTYYNGKVVCVESNNKWVTVGKIYTFKDGLATADYSTPMVSDPVKDLKDLNGRFTSIKFIEVVE